MTINWELLSIEGVTAVIEQSARLVHNVYPNTTEIEDLIQDGMLAVVETENLRVCIEGAEVQLGLLQHRLVQDLKNASERDGRNLGSRLSYERLIEASE